jgi:hypothetical protein
MSGADTLKHRAKNYVAGLPGKRGIDIPEDTYDRIFSAARGVTQPIWGRDPTPHQIQHLYDQGLHSTDQIQQAYGNLPHPHAQGLTVSEYPQYAEAYGTYVKSR